MGATCFGLQSCSSRFAKYIDFRLCVSKARVGRTTWEKQTKTS